MTDKRLRELATKPPSACDLDELETIAKAHEDMAYRYRSAISLLRWRMNQQEEASRKAS